MRSLLARVFVLNYDKIFGFGDLGMGTRAVNPLEPADKDLIDFWVSGKASRIDYEDNGQEAGYFLSQSTRFGSILESSLIDINDLQDLLVWLDYIFPDDGSEFYSFNEIKEKIEKKIEGIEKRES